MEADFSGYATKAGLKCSDGRTIMPHAFEAQDATKVPLVWQHGHNEPTNVLGHVLLENREDGVYCYGFFNGNDSGQSAKTLVQHGDINSLSIYANKLIEKSKQVIHGTIREVSLVLSGANPGALIDFVSLQHADGSVDELEDEAVIYTGLTLEHEDLPDEADASDDGDEGDDAAHADDTTLQEIYDGMSDEQKNVVAFMVGAALEQSAEHSDTDEDSDENSDNNSEGDLEHQEGTDMGRNVFDQTKKDGDTSSEGHSLSHDDMSSILADAAKSGSLRDAVNDYALAHGIESIDILFPDAKTISAVPEFDKRRTEWVAGVLSGTRHSPFARIKTLSADLTFDEARAKGYIKGTLKKEEFFGVAKRVTTPATVYKKQKLDRDDIIDITDFDVVTWMKGEMRLMLEEELARAILIGDGREADDEDKVKDGSVSGEGIRPIATEDELYATQVYVNLGDANSSASETVDAILNARRFYKGTGTPTFYTTEPTLTSLLLLKDTLGRRLYRNVAELADELRVSSIVAVEVMEDEADLIGIIVNLNDYVVGADRGGDISMFDDFDIDYNQYKYLIETRVSGALVKIKAALVIRKTASNAVLTVPAEPTFDPETGELTIVNQTGVVYKHGATVINAAGSPYTVAEGTPWTVVATPASSAYYFATSEDDTWTFTTEES